MKNSISMHVVYRFKHLIHVVPHSLLREVVSPALDGLIKIHVHEFKYEC